MDSNNLLQTFPISLPIISRNSFLRFPLIKLPPFSSLFSTLTIQTSPAFHSHSLPDNQQGIPRSSKLSRRAPKRQKNSFALALQLKNTKGKPFTFTFIPQILGTHLQYLFTGKFRYKRHRCLRLYKKEGIAMAQLIIRTVGNDVAAMRFKRRVSMKGLKKWLLGYSFGEDTTLTQQELSELRLAVLRKLCILKTIDLESNLLSDFSVEDESGKGVVLVREYITRYLWEELGFPILLEEEVTSTLSFALLSFTIN